MATTFTNLEIGQKEKEATINTNFSVVPKYLGEFPTVSEPDATQYPEGSTYYNTTTLKLRFNKSTLVWADVA